MQRILAFVVSVGLTGSLGGCATSPAAGAAAAEPTVTAPPDAGVPAPVTAEPRALTDSSRTIRGVSLSPDGTRLVYLEQRVGSMGEDVVIRDVKSGEEKNLTATHPYGVVSVADQRPLFTPDGKSIVCLNQDELVRISLEGEFSPLSTRGWVVQAFVVRHAHNDLVFFAEGFFTPDAFLAEPVSIGRLLRYDLAANSVAPLTTDAASDTFDQMTALPSGHIVNRARYPNDDGEFERLAITVIAPTGARRRLLDWSEAIMPPVSLGGSRFALLTATQPAGPGLQRLEYTSYDTQSQDKAASFVVTVPDEPWTGGLWMIPGGSGFVAALGDQDTGYRFYLVDIRTGASHQLSDVVVGSVKDGGFTADGSALYFTGGEPASRPDRLWVLPLGAR